MELKSKLKLVFLGFISGIIFNACNDNLLQADSGDDYSTESCNPGECDWNPLYVKIVE